MTGSARNAGSSHDAGSPGRAADPTPSNPPPGDPGLPDEAETPDEADRGVRPGASEADSDTPAPATSSPATSRGAGATDGSLAGTIELVSRVVAPATLVTAVLYFFGYTRERAFYGHFGVSLSTVGFSTTDYLVHGANVAFVPMATLLVLAAVVLMARPAVNVMLARSGSRTTNTIAVLVGITWITLLGIAVTGLVIPSKKVWFDVLAPVALGGAVAASVCLLALMKRNQALPDTVRHGLASGQSARTTAFVVLALVAIFWATATIGRQNGLRAARSFEHGLPVSARAVVYSHQRIAIAGPGVAFERLNTTDSAYAYRYSGLRVLQHNNGRWFLLPAGWNRYNDSFAVLINENDDGIRIDLAP